MKFAHEIVGTHGGALLPERALEHAPGAKPLECIEQFVKKGLEKIDSSGHRHFFSSSLSCSSGKKYQKLITQLS